MLGSPNFLAKNKKVKYFFNYTYPYEFLTMEDPCNYTKYLLINKRLKPHPFKL